MLRTLRNSFLCLILCWMWADSASAEIREKTLPDRVKHYFRAQSEEKKPYFFELIEKVFRVVLPDKNELPFGKSIAFLVGVSEYKPISTQLPFVKNDLTELRKFLLDKGGFDEVYVAADSTVKESLVKEYIFNIFPEKMQKQDRLLFYYSGHGADIGSGVGYMQFSKARPGKFTADQVLKIRDCTEWSRVLPAAHVLFIYDCCASGLGFTPKGETKYTRAEIIKTLSRDGSRTVITAGTAEEKTFGVENHSVFTKAMLNALNSSQNTEGFITVSQLFARIESDVKRFCQENRKTITPRRWDLDDSEYRGTFLFIDNSGATPEMPKDFSRVLNAVPKGESISAEAFGMIKVISFLSGQLYIDGVFSENVEPGDGKLFYRPAGDHRVEIRTKDQKIFKDVTVEKGKTLEVPLFAKEVPKPPEPETASLTVTCDTPGAVVEVNGKEYGKAPQNVTIIMAGTYVVKVSATGYKTYTEKKEIALGDSAKVDARLEKEEQKEQQSPADGGKTPLVKVPAGAFTMGSSDGSDDEKPPHEVYLDEYYIEKYEVSAAQFATFLNAAGNPDDKYAAVNQDSGTLVYAGGRYAARKGYEDRPANYVSWHGAKAYCESIGRRLPTEAEWEKAARGTDGRKYPWGNQSPGNNHNLAVYDYGHDEKWTDMQPVASLPAGKSPYGAHHMAGNVWEWVADWYDSGYYAKSAGRNPEGPDNGTYRVLRGGSWSFNADVIRSADRGILDPDSGYFSVGCRCAASSK